MVRPNASEHERAAREVRNRRGGSPQGNRTRYEIEIPPQAKPGTAADTRH